MPISARNRGCSASVWSGASLLAPRIPSARKYGTAPPLIESRQRNWATSVSHRRHRQCRDRQM
ncbi:hypothetical protein CAZ05_33845, partial [Pseudomonas aeruginosa]